MTIFVGSFEISSNAIRATDPCYDPDTKCAHTIENVKNGIWQSYVEYDFSDKYTISCLYIRHEHYNVHDNDITDFITDDIGVDSGQAGFYDLFEYLNNHGGEFDDLNSFYGKCCNCTNMMPNARTIEFGVTSSSGYGDGGYSLFVKKDENNNVIAAKIVFIQEDENEDNYEDNERDEYDEYDEGCIDEP